ncbi:MAG: NAD(P)H-binding protein [Acidobacteriota bacterium]
MKLVVFGASGGCGTWVVREALDRGLAVTAVVRPGSEHCLPGAATSAVGSVLDPDFVRRQVTGHDAVLSCLGLRRRSVVPWSKLLSPPDLVERFTRHLASALDESPIRRVLWISAGGVGDSHDRATRSIQAMIRAGHVGTAYADLNRAEAIMPEGDDRWLAVRPVTLTGGPPTGRAAPVDRYGLLSTIRRSDVASWMLDVAQGRRGHETPTVLLGTR